MEGKKFSDFFYQSVELFKNNFKMIFPVILILVLIDLYSMMTVGYQSDAHNIVSTIAEAFIEVILTVYLINIFLSKLTTIPFSLAKCFWDIPTYLFYELAFGICALLGALLFIVPGILVYVFYAMVPVVAIAFDHYEKDDEGVFALTKRSVMSNKGAYIAILVVGIFLGVVGQATEKIFLISGNNYAVAGAFSLLTAIFICIYTGIIISFLADSIKGNTQIETDLVEE
ncbi:hypothetical protein [Bacteriovorax sp. Seq25_V]|uniref:hypothetical protein n=1 Tax=Bacteriovorax sp. Seq25_V TaxID=1201288 RepID=UPI000389FD47|nr:hypothetical protein [Bacteriovorax sp. Seq25_V]EQC46056.1 hypothetical protein M900_1745 [Bacteriovorax sp. Seq25_V]